MDLLTIPEFTHVTKLRESELLGMLENGELEVKTGPMGELLIDVENITAESLAKRANRRKPGVNKADLALLEEMIASEITRHLEGLVDEAMELSLAWYEKRKLEREKRE